jgi:Flp pilus assembly protein TadD
MRLAILALVGLSALAPAALAVDAPGMLGAPDLSTVRAKLKAGNYQAALTDLRFAVQTYQHPDVYNLMGFALRKSGDPAEAAVWYRRALDADPDHKGALEYQGELFAETGQLAKARENLARLTRLCPKGCEELSDLRAALAAAEQRR